MNIRQACAQPCSFPSRALLESLTAAELEFIAGRNGGLEAHLHLEALKRLVNAQGGVLEEGQTWYPYEVIELCAHHLVRGHEREFTACTLLVLEAVASGFDKSTTLEWKLEDRAQDYDALPARYREAILDAYLRAGIRD